MANENLKKILEVSQKMGDIKPSNNIQNKNSIPNISLDSQVKMLDEQVYGKYEKQDTGYNAEEEMERWKHRLNEGSSENIINSLAGRNIPKKIVESIVKNPCNLEPVVDSKMEALQERLSNSKLQNALNIQKSLEKKSVDESSIENSNDNAQIIDYNKIRDIIKEIIDEKLNEKGSVTVMSLKDKFLFLDSDDNIYECKMSYKGKNKRRKK